jgi:hypothetical protein
MELITMEMRNIPRQPQFNKEAPAQEKQDWPRFHWYCHTEHLLKNTEWMNQSIASRLQERRQVSSVSITGGCGIDNRCSIPGRTRNVAARHEIQTVSLTHLVSYPLGRGFSPREERGPVVSGSDHFSPSVTEIKNVWNSASSLPYVMVWRFME